jgi:hypothetical protein
VLSAHCFFVLLFVRQGWSHHKAFLFHRHGTRWHFATSDYRFDGNFGEIIWPNGDYDLLHLKLRLDRIGIDFDRDAIAPNLSIAVDSIDRPRIDLTLSLANIDAAIHMERSIGRWFWPPAAGVLVAGAIVESIAISAIIATLIGLAPFGFPLLLLVLSTAPTAEIIGGSLLLATVTYIVLG